MNDYFVGRNEGRKIKEVHNSRQFPGQERLRADHPDLVDFRLARAKLGKKRALEAEAGRRQALRLDADLQAVLDAGVAAIEAATDQAALAKLAEPVWG